MKYNILSVLLMLFSLQIALAQKQFIKLSEQQIDPKQAIKAKELAEEMMNGMKTGDFHEFTQADATDALIKGLTPKAQAVLYGRIKTDIGDYKSLHFVEAYKTATQPEYIVYRFRGNFKLEPEGPEIRLVFNQEDQLAGFWIKPWQDSLETKP